MTTTYFLLGAWVGLALLIGLGVMRGASKAERKIEELNEDDEV